MKSCLRKSLLRCGRAMHWNNHIVIYTVKVTTNFVSLCRVVSHGNTQNEPAHIVHKRMNVYWTSAGLEGRAAQMPRGTFKGGEALAELHISGTYCIAADLTVCQLKGQGLDCDWVLLNEHCSVLDVKIIWKKETNCGTVLKSIFM